MKHVKGTDTAIMVAFEGTDNYNGTIASPVGYLMPFDSCGVLASQSKSENNTILNPRTKGKPGLGNVDVGGSVVSLLGPISAGVWLKALFGDHVKTGTGPYVHTFTPAEDVPSFALEKDMGKKLSANRYELFGGMKVGGIDLQFTQEGRQSITVNLKGASQAFANATLDGTATDYRLDDPWDGMSLSIKEGGVEMGIANAASLSFSNNLDESNGYTIPKESENEKAGTRQSLPAQFFTSNGSITAIFSDTTFLEKGKNNTESTLEIKLSRGTGDGSAGNESLVIALDQVVYERTSADISGPGGVMLSVNFESFGGVSAVLKNEEDL